MIRGALWTNTTNGFTPTSSEMTIISVVRHLHLVLKVGLMLMVDGELGIVQGVQDVHEVLVA